MTHGGRCGDLQRCREHLVPWEDPIRSLEEHGGGVAGEDACRRSRSFPAPLRDFHVVADLEESRTVPLVEEAHTTRNWDGRAEAEKDGVHACLR